MVRQLGQGGMGTAYCVRSKDGSGGGGFLALKKVACRNAAECNAAMGEAKTLQGLSHRNVVRYHNVFPVFLFIVTTSSNLPTMTTQEYPNAGAGT